MIRTEFRALRVDEQELLPFDFSGQLVAGETITSADVEIAVYSGEDANPAAVLASAASISGGVISQLVAAPLAGILYTLTCFATTSLGRLPAIQGVLAVLP